ncbi:MAG: hypothetical protein ACTSWY_05865 [Promethearchaeota archaeon]
MKIDTNLEDHFFLDSGRQGKILIAFLLIFFVFFGMISEAFKHECQKELIWLWLAFPEVDRWFFTTLGLPGSENWNYIGIIPIGFLFLTCFFVTYVEDVYLYGFKFALWSVPFIIGCSFFWYSYINFWVPREQVAWGAPSPFILLLGTWEGWLTILILYVINILGAFTGWQVKEFVKIYIKKEDANQIISTENREVAEINIKKVD